MNLAHDLMQPEAYPGFGSLRVELVQTHISWVFLLERDVFKVKRPVSFGFLDFASLEKRKAACEAEVRLNARLAPGVYLGVVPIGLDASGRHRVGHTDRIVDWAVHMARLPDSHRADQLLARDELTSDIVDTLAARLATFHAQSSTDEENARFGSPRAVSTCVDDNFAETEHTITRYIEREQALELRGWQTSFLRDKAELFEQRVAAGRVREGHGDLRLEHVYLTADGVPTIIDCIEFSDRFRWADVCADIAFLSMDLAAHGRVDLAERVLARYARETNDYDLYALVDFYESYRAFVRGKVCALVADDESIEASARRQARDSARRHFLLALSSPRPSLVRPSLVAVGGLIASGKSTIADAIANQLSAPVIDADRTRKGMLGVVADQPLHDAAWQGAYDPGVTEQVYEEVFRRAGIVLASGRAVVIDASFGSARLRKAARDLAAARGVPFAFVECRVDSFIAKKRLEQRARGRSVSDGRLEIFDAFSARFEPVDEFSDREHIILDTAPDFAETLARLRDRLGSWPEKLNG